MQPKPSLVVARKTVKKERKDKEVGAIDAAASSRNILQCAVYFVLSFLASRMYLPFSLRSSR